MGLDAGTVEATLRGNFNGAGFARFDGAMKRSLGTASAFERNAASSFSRIGRAGMLMGRTLGIVAVGGVVGLGAAIGKSISLAADFQQQLSSLGSVVDKDVTGAMNRLRAQALKAGAATKYSALQAAAAQTELAKGGLKASQILGGGLQAALGLAAAGELDLAEAAATTANAMNLFGLKGKAAQQVADGLATAANATTADVHDFSMALTQGGGAAKAAGLTFRETVSALEAMAAAGVKGSDAGTSLKTALAQLANPTAKQTELSKKLGVAFFDAHGSLKPLPAIADMLGDKLGKLTDKQRLSALQTLAGTDGFRTLLALYDAGPKKLEAWQRGLEKSGTAARVAAEKQDNLRGRLENLKGSLETAGVAVGSKFLPALERLATRATVKVNELVKNGTLDRWATSLEHGAETAAGAIASLAAGIDANWPRIQAGIGFIVDVLRDLVDAAKEIAGVAGSVTGFVGELAKLAPGGAGGGNAPSESSLKGMAEGLVAVGIAAYGLNKITGAGARLLGFGRGASTAGGGVSMLGRAFAAHPIAGSVLTLAAGLAVLIPKLREFARLMDEDAQASERVGENLKASRGFLAQYANERTRAAVAEADWSDAQRERADAHRELNAITAKGTTTGRAYEEAVSRVNRADAAATVTTKALHAAVSQFISGPQAARRKAYEAFADQAMVVQHAEEDMAAAQEKVKAAQAANDVEAYIDALARYGTAASIVASEQERLAEAGRLLNESYAREALAQANAQQFLHGRIALTRQAEGAFKDLFKTMQGVQNQDLTAKSRTQFIKFGAQVNANDILPKLDQVVNLARQHLSKPAILRIIANSKTAEQAIAGIAAKLPQIDKLRVIRIVANSQGAKAAVDSFLKVLPAAERKRVTQIVLKDGAKAGLQEIIRFLDAAGKKKPKPQVSADGARKVIDDFKSIAKQADTVGAKKPKPKVDVDTTSAIRKISEVSSSLTRIPSPHVTVTITPNFAGNWSKTVSIQVPGHAEGHKTDGPELALIGEGGGPEYVIPTESRYRGRGIDLLMMAARDLGVAAFARGRGPGEPGGPGGGRPGGMQIPAEPSLPSVTVGTVPSRGTVKRDKKDVPTPMDEWIARVEKWGSGFLDKPDRALQVYDSNFSIRQQDWNRDQTLTPREYLMWESGLRHEAELLDLWSSVAGELSRKARGAGLAGLANTWGRLSQDKAVEAKGKRADLADKIAEAQRAGAGDGSGLPGGPGAPGDAGFDLNAILDLDPRDPRRALALAQLTDSTEDDLAALNIELEDITNALAGEQAGPNRRDFVIGLADALAGVKSQIKGLSPDTSGDQAAAFDQQKRRADFAQQEADVNAGFIRTLLGSGSLGLAGVGNGGTTINVNTLHPGDPNTLRAIGDAAMGGLDQQASQPQKSLAF